MTICIVTGASQNHSKSMRQFLKSFDCSSYLVYVWDLGLTQETHQAFLDEFGNTIQMRVFDYSKYPEWFAMEKEAGQYAWKPTLIYETMKEVLTYYPHIDVLFWCDAGNFCPDGNKNIEDIKTWTYRNQLYSPFSEGDIMRWTYPATWRWFQINDNDPFLRKYENRNGAVMSFFIKNMNIQYLIYEFARCASIKECIAPEGSSRANHRQDQAVFSILYWRFFENNSMYQPGFFEGIKTHRDCD